MKNNDTLNKTAEMVVILAHMVYDMSNNLDALLELVLEKGLIPAEELEQKASIIRSDEDVMRFANVIEMYKQVTEQRARIAKAAEKAFEGMKTDAGSDVLEAVFDEIVES